LRPAGVPRPRARARARPRGGRARAACARALDPPHRGRPRPLREARFRPAWTEGDGAPRNTAALAPRALAEVFDDLDELVRPVALETGEVDQLLGAADDGASFGCAGDGDAAAAAELEQALVAKQAER